jgi:hypothetical protein
MATFLISRTVPLLFGFLFLAAGISKLLRRPSVLRSISNYHLLPSGAARVVASTLAPVEGAAGILFLLSFWFLTYRVAWTLSFGLLLIFTVAIMSALARGLKIPCGCGFLLNGHTVTWSAVGRNVLLLMLLILDASLRGFPGSGLTL